MAVACRVADPEASKPDDWDEDAPRQIEDPEDEKPEGWLDDEPEEIDDPGEQLQGCPACTPVLGHSSQAVDFPQLAGSRVAPL